MTHVGGGKQPKPKHQMTHPAAHTLSVCLSVIVRVCARVCACVYERGVGLGACMCLCFVCVQRCEGMRPDVQHLDQSMMTYEWFKKKQVPSCLSACLQRIPVCARAPHTRCCNPGWASAWRVRQARH